jgi:hypothetical protein
LKSDTPAAGDKPAFSSASSAGTVDESEFGVSFPFRKPEAKPMNQFGIGKLFVRCVFTAAILLALNLPASALTFNVTFDSSVTSLANAAQVETAFTNATLVFQSLYTNSSSVNITVYWGNAWPHGSIGLGASYSTAYGAFPYSTLTNAMRNSRTTVADSNSVASLPANDPAASAGAVWYIPRAEIKALGLASSIGTTANDTSNDGDVGFANTIYTFDPTNRAVSGQSDFIAVAEHEISEVMGRITFLRNSSGIYVPYDLFRFTNSSARNFSTNATGVYFSADNGVTSLKIFNVITNGGDIQDWQSTNTADVYDAFLTVGQQAFLSSADLTAVDILGYDLNFHPPHLSGTRLTNGNFQLTFTNVSGLNFSILASTNIATAVTNWTVLGTPTETPTAGQYQFTDSVTNKTRFYRVRLN